MAELIEASTRRPSRHPLQENAPTAAGAPPVAAATPAGRAVRVVAAAPRAAAAPGAAEPDAEPPTGLIRRPNAEADCAAQLWQLSSAAEALSDSAIRAILKTTERPQMLSFAGGAPNPAAFPVAAIRSASERVLRDDAGGALQYGPTEGYGPLRELVAERLSRAGQPTRCENVLITTGSQQALDLIGKAFLSPGAPLLAANPSYLGALQAFALYQPSLLEIEVDGEESLPAARFCYLTPTFANPTGDTLSLAQRQSLLRRLSAAGVPLIEDDAYGDLWLDTPPPPACQALAPEQTLYLGSFSKVLAPGLRVGYVAGPRAMIEALTRLKQAADLHTPSFNQRIVAALIADGTLDAQLPTLRALYRRQRDALLAALDRHWRGAGSWQTPAGGMFVWLRLNGGGDAAQLFDAALARDVAFVPGAPFYFARPDPSTIRLAFSTVPAERMDEGMQRLAKALAELAV
jgi:2-aminoadipate transaminase